MLYQRRGAGDPTMTIGGAVDLARFSARPQGIATLALRESAPGVIRGAAWGPGAAWALAQLPALCGALDDLGGIRRRHCTRSSPMRTVGTPACG